MDNSSVKQYYLASMTPQELVLEMLEKTCACLTQACITMAQKEYDFTNSLLIEAQSLLTELQNMQQIPTRASLCAAEVLELFIQRLFLANIDQDLDELKEVTTLVGRLRVVYASSIGKI